MARPKKFGDDVVKRAVELRGRGFTYSDIRDALGKEFGEAPKEVWVYNHTRHVEGEKAVARIGAVDRVRTIAAEVEHLSAAEASAATTERLIKLADELETERKAVSGNPSAVATLSRTLLQTLALIDKRTPPPEPPKEDDPDWVLAAAQCREKMHALLDRIIESKNGQPPQVVSEPSS